nr:pyridine nucleotide-disulfide oxidoreductase domain-containing protein 2-like [Penaeus vannamei]
MWHCSSHSMFLTIELMADPGTRRPRKSMQKRFLMLFEYAPGFKDSIVGYEVLPPPELERIFGLTGGNIFHGSMSLDQLFISRPSSMQPGPFTPIPGLFLCGSGAHPGGGVMAAPGRLAALSALQ